MADNFVANPGAGGKEFASKDVGGVQFPRNIITDPSGVDITPLTDTALRASAVEVTATALTTLASAVKAEDSASVDGDPGVVMLAVRRDTDSPAVGADGDYTALKMDETGRLKVASKPASYPDITGDITAIQATIGTPVAGGTVSGDVSRASNIMALCSGTFSTVNCTFEGSLEATGDTNWFGIQAVRSNANTIETATGNLSAQPVYGWEMSVNALKRVRVRATARASGTQSWRFVLGTYATEPIPAAQVSATQPVSGTVTATPVTPSTTFTNSAATTNATSIKASAGTLWSVSVSNTNAAARFLKLYNKASAPTVGSDVPVLTVVIPATSVITVNGGSNGIRFATGIAFAITAAATDADTTAVAAAEIKVSTTFT